MPVPNSLFRSFWQAGYEGADHINRLGQALDMNRVTRHDIHVKADYALLDQFGVRTVRESIGWRLVDTDHGYDFSSVEPRARAAQELGLQVIWTLNHYGWPAGVDVLSPAFVERFARYCEAMVRYLAPYTDGVPFYSPINEISFLAFAVCDAGMINPQASIPPARGYEFKQQLVRAAIAACDAIWEVEPHARIMQCDPVVHVIAASTHPELVPEAAAVRAYQFQAWDMLGGLAEPQLGGSPKYLDIIGVNYYHSNQWEHPTDERLHWHLGDKRRVPFHQLLEEMYARYQRPLYVAETSHVGVGRGKWITEVTEQAIIALERGVPLEGICLYPILDRPGWDDLDHWHNSGLWDFMSDPSDELMRVLDQPYAEALRRAQRLLENSVCKSASSDYRGNEHVTPYRLLSPALGLCVAAAAALTDALEPAWSRGLRRRTGLYDRRGVCRNSQWRAERNHPVPAYAYPSQRLSR